jgi:uncharacterized protein YdhG (YjbR/CyaY superfamily)
MWRCEKCGREFVKINRERRCGKFATVDDYISAQDPAVQPVLHEVRRFIRAQAPEAVEQISWGMPTFRQGKNRIHFAACKHHLGIYPGDLTSSPFADRLSDYKHSKGAIHFPYDKAIDYALIAEIVRHRLENSASRTTQ